MHEKKKLQLVRQFIQMLNSAQEAASDNTRQRGPDAIRNGFDMSFVDDKEFFALNDVILKERAYQQKFSPYYIREQLIELIYRLAEDGNITEESVKAAVDALETKLDSYSDVAEVYIPLVGIKMTLPKLELGNVTLVNMDESRLESLKQRVIEGKLFSKLTLEQRQEAAEHDIAEFRDHILNMVCARIEVLGDVYRALDVAEEECGKVVDLLRYALPFLYFWRPRTYVGMQGWLAHGPRQLTTLMAWSSGWIGSSQSRKGSLRDFELNHKAFFDMVSTRVFELAEVVKAGRPTAFEQTLLSAVHWFASAQTELDPQYQFLSMTICLETLFTPEAGEPITKTVAEGVAIVAGTDLEMRKKWKSRMLELYGVRSAIAHRGKVEIADQDIYHLQEITMTVLRNLITRRGEFINKEALAKWIDEQRLTYVGPTVVVPDLLSWEVQRDAFYRYVEPATVEASLAAAFKATQESAVVPLAAPDFAEPEMLAAEEIAAVGQEQEQPGAAPDQEHAALVVAALPEDADMSTKESPVDRPEVRAEGDTPSVDPKSN